MDVDRRREASVESPGVRDAPMAGAGSEPEVDPATVDVEGRASALLAAGLTRKDIVQTLVEETGLARNEVYRRVTDLPS